MPVSTTHVISGAIMGAGASPARERGPLGRDHPHPLGLAWLITLPASGISAALAYLVLNPILGAAGAA